MAISNVTERGKELQQSAHGTRELALNDKGGGRELHATLGKIIPAERQTSIKEWLSPMWQKGGESFSRVHIAQES